VADHTGVPAPSIDTSAPSRAKVGLAPGTAPPLVGWGLRASGGPGWYVDPSGPGTSVINVLSTEAQARVAQLHKGRTLVPVVTYHRGHRGAPERGWISPDHVAQLVAVPDADARFLVYALQRDPDLSRRGPALPLVRGSESDPLFLMAALVCESTPELLVAPVHEGQLGPRRLAVLRTAKAGYDQVLAAAALLVDAPGRWGGTLADVSRRAADVLLARYPELTPRLASDALTRSIDARSSPVMPDVGPLAEQHAPILSSLWRRWAFGPRSSVEEGRHLVRTGHPEVPEHEVDRRLVWLVVALQLAAPLERRPA
jgi:hypothetical protein